MLPNLVIIGAMKAGTTSVHRYLALHPEIFMSKQKELNFFVEQEAWKNGVSWYEAQFDSDAKVRGEASPNYTKYPRFEGIPKRMSGVIPDAKLIYLVRDPVQRILSHYVDAYSWGREPRPIDEIVSDPSYKNYVNCSRYAMQLEQYLDYYPASSILVVQSEELRQQRRSALRRIFSFLDVEESFWTDAFEELHWQGAQKLRKTRTGYALVGLVETVRTSRLRPFLPRTLARPVRAVADAAATPIETPAISPEPLERLVATLRPDVERLRELTGQNFASWPLFGADTSAAQ